MLGSLGAAVSAMDALSASSWALVNTVANTAAIGRLGCRINKYVLWITMALFCTVARKTVESGNELSFMSQLWPYTWLLSVVGVLIIGKKRVSSQSKEEAIKNAKAI